ncbi:MAG: alpha/beta hydrolase fold domain-containing protein [Pseudomonadota bacterium]|nr:alpha/beta hydrolase fold domain-containing protein [Pseudomonadota bacterium]
MAENSTGTVYTATANDADGETLSFSIGGTDAGNFSINASSGELSFDITPDFENPADANGDNSYVITITVRDPRGGSATLNLTLTVTDIVENGQRYIDQIFSSIDEQRGIAFAPGLEMDVLSPAGDTVTDRPVLILASGGGFLTQDRTSVERIAEAFVRRGYVAVTIDYRVLGSAPLTADDLAVAGIQATHDLFAAVRFMRADALGGNTFGIRADAIFVGGESAGGVMSAIAATLDAGDAISSAAVAAYLAGNGGVFGDIGDNDSVSSQVNGALPLSGAILDLSSVDATSAPMYAAHEEFDPVVPCDTDTEGSSFTGLVVSGSCDIVAAYTAASAAAELFLVAGSAGHVAFSDDDREQIYAGAATLFFNEVISP